MSEGSESRDAVAGAEAAFASYLARVKQGETVDFELFCEERPALADSLRVLFDAWQSRSDAVPPDGDVETIGEFLSNRQQRGNISLDPDAPAGESGSGIRDRLTQLGRRTGRYTLREEVARGGMGVILKIWDKDLRRTLAMKASFHHFGKDEKGEVPTAAQEIVARFVDEAQITAQLDHPGIVPVHELGVDNDGRMYFTMRLVKGQTLDEIIRLARADKDGWSRPRAVGVMVRVCEAMAYAHAKGVIHRDLKPANIMVGDFGEVYVMDWGLAKVLGRHDPHQRAWEAAASVLRTQVRTDRLDDLMATPDSPLLTMEGMVIGTPTYMPPEQAEGRIDALDPRSDVYSVGALLYTLLTGRMPYVDPAEPPTAGKVLMALIEGPPTPVLDLDPGVPPELVAICEKAMARNPDDRYPTMGEMAEDLRAFVENRVVRAYATGPMAEFRKWVRRNRAVAASILLLVVVTLAGSFYVAWQQNAKYAEVSALNRQKERALAVAEENERKERKAAAAAQRNLQRAERQSYLASLAASHASLEMSEIVEARTRLEGCPQAHRGWEWDFLWYATDTSVRVLDGGGARITAVRFSPDGSRLVVGTANDSIRVWDLAAGRSFPLPDAPRSVTSLAMSADGGRIAAASKSSNVRIWDAGSATLERMLPHDSDVTSVAFLGADGARIVTGDDGGAHIWDVGEQQRIATLEHDFLVAAIAASEDGRFLVTADDDGAHVYDVATGERRHSIELDEGATCVALREGRIAVGSRDEHIRIASLEDGSVIRVLSGHTDPVTEVRFNADGTRLVSSSLDRTLRVWDVARGSLVEVLRGHSDRIRTLDMSAEHLVSGSDDGTLRLWRPVSGGHVLTLRGDEDYLAAVAFDPTRGDVAAASAGHGEIRVWNPSTGKELRYIPPVREASLSALAYSPDGKWIVAGSDGDGTGRIHDASTGELVHTLQGHAQSVTAVAIDGESRRVVTGSVDRTVRVWNIDGTGEPVVLEGHGTRVNAVAIADDRIASGDDDGVLRVWRNGKATELRGHEGAILAVAFSPDGGILASAGADHTIRFWSRDGAAGPVLRGHGDKVRALAFHPDGSRLASASQDKTVRVWDVEAGEQLLRIPAHSEWATGVAFSADGHSLASSSFDTTAKVWRTRAPTSPSR